MINGIEHANQLIADSGGTLAGKLEIEACINRLYDAKRAIEEGEAAAFAVVTSARVSEVAAAREVEVAKRLAEVGKAPAVPEALAQIPDELIEQPAKK